MQVLLTSSKLLGRQLWLNIVDIIPSHKRVRWGVGLLCTLSATVAIGFVPVPVDSSKEPQTDIIETVPMPALKPITSNDEQRPFIREERISTGDSVASILSRMNVNDPAFTKYLKQSDEAKPLFNLSTGRSIQAGIDPQGKIIWLRYMQSPSTQTGDSLISQMLQINRKGDSFTTQELQLEGTRHVVMASGVIDNSFYNATDTADIPDAIASKMIDAMSSQIDFHRDLRKGDSFRVVYEIFTYQGKYLSSGKVLAIEFVNSGKAYSAVWFGKDQEEGAYYDMNGTNLRKTFARSPVPFTRISSGFSMRLHPIHHTWRQHQGVDYAAPIGTPVMTTADAMVDFVGTQNGYGNIVILKHHDQYSTAYAHLNGFAKGLKKGDRITQGTVIGYVGNTGASTGPHLHYELRIAGKAVDPQKVALPTTSPKEDAKRKTAFKKETAPYKEKIELMQRIDQAIQTAKK